MRSEGVGVCVGCEGVCEVCEVCEGREVQCTTCKQAGFQQMSTKTSMAIDR